MTHYPYNKLDLPNESIKIYENFFSVLDRLIKQKAINTNDLQIHGMIENELEILQTIIKNIFINMKADRILYECNIKELINSKDEYFDLPQKIYNHPNQVMSFAMVIFYKTLPCPNGQNCKNNPREIAPYNQYTDNELSCIFYHHHKDRRRLSIASRVKEEFLYKANYDKKRDTLISSNNCNYSKNYFESVYHPIYYKLFKCKRPDCKQSYFCPFNHGNLEKFIWDEIFQNYILKKREMYTGKNFNSSLKELTKISFDLADNNNRYFESETQSRYKSCINNGDIYGNHEYNLQNNLKKGKNKSTISMELFLDDYIGDTNSNSQEDQAENINITNLLEDLGKSPNEIVHEKSLSINQNASIENTFYRNDFQIYNNLKKREIKKMDSVDSVITDDYYWANNDKIGKMCLTYQYISFDNPKDDNLDDDDNNNDNSMDQYLSENIDYKQKVFKYEAFDDDNNHNNNNNNGSNPNINSNNSIDSSLFNYNILGRYFNCEKIKNIMNIQLKTF